MGVQLESSRQRFQFVKNVPLRDKEDWEDAEAEKKNNSRNIKKE